MNRSVAINKLSEQMGLTSRTLQHWESEGLSKNMNYQSDRTRLCLEEHIRNERPEGSGNEYHLILMEPAKLFNN